jgi:hypothetical protein
MKAHIKKTKTKAKGKLLEVFRPRAALNAVVLTLQLLQSAADLIPAPALKTALGVLLLVIGTIQVCNDDHPHSNINLINIRYQKVKQNTEDFVELDVYLNRLNEVLNTLTRVEPSDVPWALRERIIRLAGYIIRYLLHPIIID